MKERRRRRGGFSPWLLSAAGGNNSVFLDPHHYNFRSLEKRYYYLYISKHTIIIFRFSRKCHRIRMKTTWAQLQMYTNTYIALKALSPITDSRALHVIFFLLFS